MVSLIYVHRYEPETYNVVINLSINHEKVAYSKRYVDRCEWSENFDTSFRHD